MCNQKMQQNNVDALDIISTYLEPGEYFNKDSAAKFLEVYMQYCKNYSNEAAVWAAAYRGFHVLYRGDEMPDSSLKNGGEMENSDVVGG